MEGSIGFGLCACGYVGMDKCGRVSEYKSNVYGPILKILFATGLF